MDEIGHTNILNPGLDHWLEFNRIPIRAGNPTMLEDPYGGLIALGGDYDVFPLGDFEIINYKFI